MKLICDACGETGEPGSIDVIEGSVQLTCAACGHVNEMTTGGEAAKGAEPAEVAGDPAAQDPDDEAVDPTDEAPQRVAGLPPHKCPRCFHRQFSAKHCERCGLDLSSSDDLDEDWDEVDDASPEAYARAVELWDRVIAEPSSDERHGAFVTHCTDNQLLTYAVRRYRDRLSDNPDEAMMAEYRDAAVRKLEAVALSLLATDRWSDDVASRVRTAKRVLMVIAVVLVVIGLVVLILAINKQARTGTSAF